MKKFAYLVLLFSAIMAFGQTHRFVYEYKFAPDIRQKDSLLTEMMALDIDAKGSVYQSIANIKRDSAVYEQVKLIKSGLGNTINMRGMFVKIRYIVQKDYPDFKTSLIMQIAAHRYKVAETEKQNWKILPETQKIAGYTCQKATTSWGGRDWTAWFTTALPFQDGPYKFSGLPGLIVKIEDATGTQRIALLGNSTIKTTLNDELIRNDPGLIPVSEEQFRKVMKDDANDPGAKLRQMATTEHTVYNADGKPMDMNELARQAAIRQKKAHQKNNNHIEPTLFDLNLN